MQTLTFEEIDMVSGAGGFGNSVLAGAGGAAVSTGVGAFVGGFVEGAELGAAFGPVGMILAGAAGGGAGYIFRHMLR